MARLFGRNRTVERLLQRHVDRSGVIIRGRFRGGIYAYQSEPWDVVDVALDGKRKGSLVHGRDVLWIDAGVGDHRLEVLGVGDDGNSGTNVRLRTEDVVIATGSTVWLVEFRVPAPLPRPIRREGRWRMAMLRT